MCVQCGKGQAPKNGKCVCDEGAHMISVGDGCQCNSTGKWFQVGDECVSCKSPEYELVIRDDGVADCMCKDGRYYNGEKCVRCTGGQTFDHALAGCGCPEPGSIFVNTSVVQKCVVCPADSEAADGACVCRDAAKHFDGFFCSACPVGSRGDGETDACVPLCAPDSGMVWDSASIACVCLNAHMTPDAAGTACVCPQGQRKTAPAVCECVDRGMIVNENGLCSSRCVRGYVFEGSCVATCPAGWDTDEAEGLCKEKKRRVSTGLVVGICVASLIAAGAVVCVVHWLRRSGLRTSKKFRQRQHRTKAFQ